MSRQFDVVIVGAGIFGLSVAWFCARKNLRTLVIEQAKVGAGASGGLVGALSPHMPDLWNEKKQFQLEALLSAGEFWAEVDALSGMHSGFRNCGRLIPLFDDNAIELAKSREVSADELWPQHCNWRVVDADKGLFGGNKVKKAVNETLSSALFPLAAVRSLAAALKTKGVEIRELSQVEQVEDHFVSGPFGRIDAGCVILASGYQGFKFIDKNYGMSLGKGVKGQAVLLECDLRHHPVIFNDGLYIVPHHFGSTAIGSTSENSWEYEDTDERIMQLAEQAVALVPALQGAQVTQTWAGIRPRGLRPDPLIGMLPGHSQVIVVNGAFKIGFGIAHKIGEKVAGLIDGKELNLPETFTLDWQLGRRR